MSEPVDPSDIGPSIRSIAGSSTGSSGRYEPPPTHVTAAIVFEKGTTKLEAERLLELMAKKLLDGSFFPEVIEFSEYRDGKRVEPHIQIW